MHSDQTFSVSIHPEPIQPTIQIFKLGRILLFSRVFEVRILRKIAIISQKGGVGKTTTTVHLAAGLAKKGKKVLILDLDPQGNVSTCFFANSPKNMYHLLVDQINPTECIMNVGDLLDIIPSDKNLAKAELTLAGVPSRETVLKRRLESVNNYDYIIIDCPPSLSLLSQNAMNFAKEAIIPVATEYLSIDALRKTNQTIDEANELFKHKLKITHIIPTMYDKRIKSCIKSLAEIKKGYNGLVTEPVRINAKLKEAPERGMSTFDFAKSSRGAKDYMKIVDKVLDSEFYN